MTGPTKFLGCYPISSSISKPAQLLNATHAMNPFNATHATRPMHRSHTYRRRERARPPEPRRFTPAADPRLKRVFARIGVPASEPFTPDRFQVEALAAVEHGDCLVTAPTG